MKAPQIQTCKDKQTEQIGCLHGLYVHGLVRYWARTFPFKDHVTEEVRIENFADSAKRYVS